MAAAAAVAAALLLVLLVPHAHSAPPTWNPCGLRTSIPGGNGNLGAADSTQWMLAYSGDSSLVSVSPNTTQTFPGTCDPGAVGRPRGICTFQTLAWIVLYEGATVPLSASVVLSGSGTPESLLWGNIPPHQYNTEWLFSVANVDSTNAHYSMAGSFHKTITASDASGSSGISVAFEPTWTNLGSCTRCGPGTFAGRDQRSCLACPPGTWSDWIANAACYGTICAPGTFGPAGSTSSGPATCSVCDAGSFSPAGATTCAPCPSGQWTGALLAIGCAGEPCAPGQAGPLGANASAAATCTLCAASSFAYGGSPSCASCTSGAIFTSVSAGCSPGASLGGPTDVAFFFGADASEGIGAFVPAGGVGGLAFVADRRGASDAALDVQLGGAFLATRPLPQLPTGGAARSVSLWVKCAAPASAEGSVMVDLSDGAANNLTERLQVRVLPVTADAIVASPLYTVSTLRTPVYDIKPIGIVIAARTLYVSDIQTHRIVSYDLDNGAALPTVVAGTGTAGSNNGFLSTATLNSPRALAVNLALNKLYVGEWASCIRVIDFTTSWISTLAGSCTNYGNPIDAVGTNALFNGVNALAFAKAAPELLYVSDVFNVRVRIVNVVTGQVTTLAGSLPVGFFADGVGSNSHFSDTHSLVVDPSNSYLLVADSGNYAIRQIDLSSSYVTTPFGSMTGHEAMGGDVLGNYSSALFVFPSAVEMDLHGNVYVFDGGCATIMRFTPGGQEDLLAGSQDCQRASAFPYYVDGDGTTARFLGPWGEIAADSFDGAIYVTDTNAGKVRKLTPARPSPEYLGAPVCSDGSTWHHVAVVAHAQVDGYNAVSLYVDGALAAASSLALNTANGSAAALSLGGSSDASAERFAGQLDELRVYARALSAAEVLLLAATPAPSATPTSSPPASSSPSLSAPPSPTLSTTSTTTLSRSVSVSVSPSPTLSTTSTASVSPSSTGSLTPSATASPSSTPSLSPSALPSATASLSGSPTHSPSASPTRSMSTGASASATPAPPSPSAAPASNSSTSTSSASHSVSLTATAAVSAAANSTAVSTPSLTSGSASAPFTAAPQNGTAAVSTTPTVSPTPTVSASSAASSTSTASSTATASTTPTSTASTTSTATASVSLSPSASRKVALTPTGAASASSTSLTFLPSMSPSASSNTNSSLAGAAETTSAAEKHRQTLAAALGAAAAVAVAGCAAALLYNRVLRRRARKLRLRQRLTRAPSAAQLAVAASARPTSPGIKIDFATGLVQAVAPADATAPVPSSAKNTGLAALAARAASDLASPLASSRRKVLSSRVNEAAKAVPSPAVVAGEGFVLRSLQRVGSARAAAAPGALTPAAAATESPSSTPTQKPAAAAGPAPMHAPVRTHVPTHVPSPMPMPAQAHAHAPAHALAAAAPERIVKIEWGDLRPELSCEPMFGGFGIVFAARYKRIRVAVKVPRAAALGEGELDVDVVVLLVKEAQGMMRASDSGTNAHVVQVFGIVQGEADGWQGAQRLARRAAARIKRRHKRTSDPVVAPGSGATRSTATASSGSSDGSSMNSHEGGGGGGNSESEESEGKGGEGDGDDAPSYGPAPVLFGLVMSFEEGGSLQDALFPRGRRRARAPWPAKTADKLRLAAEAASGLYSLHALGIVHGDLKRGCSLHYLTFAAASDRSTS